MGRIVEVTEPGALLESVYRSVLEPNFPAAELETYQDLATGLASTTTVFAALDVAGNPIAAAVGNHWAPHPVVLLTYLAVTRGLRGSGLGGGILEHALDAWQRRYRPHVIVAETEDPACHGPHPLYGDPTRRWSFYCGHGARVILLPYVQPEVRTGCGRREGMRLIALRLGDAERGIDTAIFRGFLRTYFEACEGRPPVDAATGRIFAALQEPYVRPAPLC
ncbi:hypothetical protein [Glycomyces sp. NRRL B-16210]|uniref:hypothetical protein n=1 Tax=Glycomyces sp. NRRL B-16210 TaxID=1463821 RepID=UPI0006918E9E|nr:hypothetical protein [Glycomyces sp. NRRL B-16210]